MKTLPLSIKEAEMKNEYEIHLLIGTHIWQRN